MFVSLNWPSGWCVLSLEVRPACTAPGTINCTKQQRNSLVEMVLSLNKIFTTDRSTKKLAYRSSFNWKMISVGPTAERRTAVVRCAGSWGRGPVFDSGSSLGCSVLCESWMKDVINTGSLTERLISEGWAEKDSKYSHTAEVAGAVSITQLAE